MVVSECKGLLPLLPVLRHFVAHSMGSLSAACYDSEETISSAARIHLDC
jgi:hypothetical protein